MMTIGKRKRMACSRGKPSGGLEKADYTNPRVAGD
jgi:hypothetical protein